MRCRERVRAAAEADGGDGCGDPERKRGEGARACVMGRFLSTCCRTCLSQCSPSTTCSRSTRGIRRGTTTTFLIFTGRLSSPQISFPLGIEVYLVGCLWQMWWCVQVSFKGIASLRESEKDLSEKVKSIS